MVAGGDAFAVARCRDALPHSPAPGGAVEERGPDGRWHRWGTVESVEAGRRLRFTWHPGREPNPPSGSKSNSNRQGRERAPR